MTKQATFGSLLETFNTYISGAAAQKIAGSATQEAQGYCESGESVGKADAGVAEMMPTGTAANKDNETVRGAASGEAVPGVSTNLPMEELEREESEPSKKIAAPDAISALSERLKLNLQKVAAPAAPAPAAEPAVETPVTAEAPASTVNVDELAQKTAEFVRYNELGYRMASEFFAQAAPAQKEAALDISAAQEETRQKIAAYVHAAISDSFNSGEISQKSANDLLAKLGFTAPEPAALDNLRQAVEQKVASLQAEGKSDEEISAFLKQAAEADAAAMAQGAPTGEPSQEELSALVQQAVAELEAAVQAGQITEEQAVQLLEQAGLNVDALAQAAGAAPEAAPAVPAEAAPAAEEAPKEEAPKEEAPKEEAPKDEAHEKKEANLPPEAAAAPAPEGAPTDDGGLSQLPPEIQQAIAGIEAAVQAGAISEEQGMAALDALIGGAAGAPAGPEAPVVA